MAPSDRDRDGEPPGEIATGPVPVQAAATIVLLRDSGRGLEVLMLRKASGRHFAAGAWVFPGGKVEPADAALAQETAEGDEFGPLKTAAIREMYEECGIILARRGNGADMLDAAEVAEIRAAHAGAAFHDLATAAAIQPVPDRLVRFAHWITPPGRPRRYDTHFFIAPAPAGQVPVEPDGYEIVDARWRKPANILDEVRAGNLKLVLPTLMNIIKLDQWDSVAAALDEAARMEVVCIRPERVETPDGVQLVIPEEAGYGVTSVPAAYLRSS